MSNADPGDPLEPGVLRALVAGTAAATGEAFFAELVKHVARALGTYGAWVTEWLPERRRLRALSFWAGAGLHGDYEYEVRGTPCEAVVAERRLVHVSDRVIELFPGDPDLRAFGAVSYLGVPLLDTDGAVLGHLAVLDTKPLAPEPRITGVFEIFAGRAAAELRRLRRDRDLLEREEKHARLLDSVMDAVVELDGELRVAGVNRAAEQVFGIEAAALVRTPLRERLDEASSDKLAVLSGELARRPEGQQALWISGGLAARRADGRPFPAEATLSRFTLRGRAFFTLILRDVHARDEAEARIRALLDETLSLRSELDALHGFDELVGESPALRNVLSDVERVAAEETTVLVTGETGTGKELIARAIHRRSARAAGPLVTVNCAAIAATLQESELFGHEKGAFTGATQRREGRFQLADKGTIFLDEVGELPLDLQAKLLRVLQGGELQPVGSSRAVRVDVRVVAATNRDLERMVEAGTFRQDLYYRLSVFPVRLPPLRERGDDVVLLANAFAARLARRRGRTSPPRLPEGGAALLRGYDWPGNIRELQNVIERAWITSTDGRTLNLDRALPEVARPTAAPVAGRLAGDTERIWTAAELRELERQNMLRALERARGKISGAGGAAELLGQNANTLSSRMKALGVKRPAPDRG